MLRRSVVFTNAFRTARRWLLLALAAAVPIAAVQAADAAFAPAASAPAVPATAAQPLALYQLVAARLGFMRDVAAHKWAHGLPVEDPDREVLVVAAGIASGLQHGLTSQSSERLFLAQIGAAKDIQATWFERWRAGEPVPGAPDLATEIRPELLDLGTAIVAAAAAAIRRPHSKAQFAAVVDIDGLSEAAAGMLFDALSRVERYPNRLAQIFATGLLRVGTTGDYPPFSLRETNGYAGIDVDLAADLAAALGVGVRFVETSWPDLVVDLVAGEFDIAMSGVSRTLARQREGVFSIAYYAGGKSAIARCADVQRYTSLADIDQPGVRVIVNPGGTNERFVDANVQHATKLLHADNRTIFETLVADGADLMITDAIEVDFQSRRHAGLCRSVSGTFTYQEKGYLMPVAPVLKAFVDTWLELRVREGFVAETFRRHGVEHRAPGDN